MSDRPNLSEQMEAYLDLKDEVQASLEGRALEKAAEKAEQERLKQRISQLEEECGEKEAELFVANKRISQLEEECGEKEAELFVANKRISQLEQELAERRKLRFDQRSPRPMTKDQEPDGWLVFKEGKEGNPYCYWHVIFPYQMNVLDWAKRNISKGWCIRPVRLVLLDEDNDKKPDGWV